MSGQVVLPRTVGRQEIPASKPRCTKEMLETLQNNGVSEATSFIMPGFVIKADSRQYS